MATLKSSDFSDELKNDLTAVHSLLNEDTGNVLDVEQLNEQPPTILSSGIKFSSDPIFGTRTVVVQPGENIQQAIDLVNDRGGGTVVLMPGTHDLISNLTMFSKIALIGLGSNGANINADNALTIIDGNNSNFKIDCTSINNFQLKDFTFQFSSASIAIDIDDCDSFKVEEIQLLSCAFDGLQIIGSSNFIVNKVASINSEGDGFHIGSGASINDTYLITNCTANGSVSDGFAIFGSTNGTFINCVSEENSAQGFLMNFTDVTNAATFIVCSATGNSVDGFRSTSSGNNHSFIACKATQNGVYGFNASSSSPRVLGCDSSGNGSHDFNFSTSRSVLSNNQFKRGVMPEVWQTKPLATDLFEGEMVAVRSASFKGMVARINGMALYFNADASSTTTSTSSTTTSSTTSSSTTSSSSTTTV